VSVRRHRAAAIGAAVTTAALAAPAAASAHGISSRADLPIPEWLFGWAAALVLVASFAGLALLWPRPRLQHVELHPLPRGLSRVLTHPALEALCGAIGVGLLVVVVWSGLAGTENQGENLAPTFIYVIFWVGLVPLSVLFGDVFSVFNPWRAVGRLAGRLVPGDAEPLAYPAWLGYWPAAAGLLGFSALELVLESGTSPLTLAIAILVYSTVTWFAMALFGVEQWCRRGEAFAVYYGLLARLSPVARRGRELALRPPLSGLPPLPVAAGLVGLVSVMIGGVTFDGLSAGPAWQSILDGLLPLLDGLGPAAALEVASAIGLLACVGLVALVYVAAVRGAAGGQRDTVALARGFAHTLVPIALAYVAAHYVSLLLFQGQAVFALASDPLGDGTNLFGTATWGIDYGLLGATAQWYLQVAFVVAGHVGGLILAHDRALAEFEDPRMAVRSQYWLLAAMVGFTTLALWLLAQASGG
jgi:hypothetical protein